MGEGVGISMGKVGINKCSEVLGWLIEMLRIEKITKCKLSGARESKMETVMAWEPKFH